jgi:hypothetical protein
MELLIGSIIILAALFKFRSNEKIEEYSGNYVTNVNDFSNGTNQNSYNRISVLENDKYFMGSNKSTILGFDHKKRELAGGIGRSNKPNPIHDFVFEGKMVHNYRQAPGQIDQRKFREFTGKDYFWLKSMNKHDALKRQEEIPRPWRANRNIDSNRQRELSIELEKIKAKSVLKNSRPLLPSIVDTPTGGLFGTGSKNVDENGLPVRPYERNIDDFRYGLPKTAYIGRLHTVDGPDLNAMQGSTIYDRARRITNDRPNVNYGSKYALINPAAPYSANERSFLAENQENVRYSAPNYSVIRAPNEQLIVKDAKGNIIPGRINYENSTRIEFQRTDRIVPESIRLASAIHRPDQIIYITKSRAPNPNFLQQKRNDSIIHQPGQIINATNSNAPDPNYLHQKKIDSTIQPRASYWSYIKDFFTGETENASKNLEHRKGVMLPQRGEYEMKGDFEIRAELNPKTGRRETFTEPMYLQNGKTIMQGDIQREVRMERRQQGNMPNMTIVGKNKERIISTKAREQDNGRKVLFNPNMAKVGFNNVNSAAVKIAGKNRRVIMEKNYN